MLHRAAAQRNRCWLHADARRNSKSVPNTHKAV